MAVRSVYKNVEIDELEIDELTQKNNEKKLGNNQFTITNEEDIQELSSKNDDSNEKRNET